MSIALSPSTLTLHSVNPVGFPEYLELKITQAAMMYLQRMQVWPCASKQENKAAPWGCSLWKKINQLPTDITLRPLCPEWHSQGCRGHWHRSSVKVENVLSEPANKNIQCATLELYKGFLWSCCNRKSFATVWWPGNCSLFIWSLSSLTCPIPNTAYRSLWHMFLFLYLTLHPAV